MHSLLYKKKVELMFCQGVKNGLQLSEVLLLRRRHDVQIVDVTPDKG